MDENHKIEEILAKILDYQSKHKVDDDSILIMLSLLNLMGMVNVLNRREESCAAPTGTGTGLGNIEALLGPLMALMASGMGKGGSGSGQGSFNPAALLSLLSGGLGGGQSKGAAPDLSALFGLLGPLLGMGAGQPSGSSPDQVKGAGNGSTKSQPVQREINLDEKYKTPTTGAASAGIDAAGEKKERPPKPGEVLKWKFGT
ncbi:hypothetical protein [Desulfoscipio gibsoniae]|uniref:Uncharacterized protein n=1 Tax=Desulfoscipio gibsoniae DSM 7213 TaxID=767817 RepID=R4K974_9FIRM|nr:hypothetical protein [Desulfoscipio gibsoniae]AGK99727.1 hypothetical protein Desgi_0113 [Desulfoscipio gibsoniae DSM 7213]